MLKSMSIKGVLIASAAVVVYVACGQSHTNEPAVTTRDVKDADFPLNATSASGGGTKVLNDQTFSVPSSVLGNNAKPAALQAALLGQENTAIKFTGVEGANGTATLTNPTATGTVKFASCEFSITAPPELVGTIFIENCSITVNANGVSTSTGATGTASLKMNGVTGTPTTVTVKVDASGKLIVNEIATNITLPPISGANK